MYRVLVVDDELPIREELLLFAFEKLGCVACGQAENGQKALEFLQTNLVDILITDIRMPVMDGLQLIETVKQRFPDIQFILLSCINDFEPIQHALKLGVVDYILKGTYTDDELASAVLKAVTNIEKLEKDRSDRIRDDYRTAVRLLSRLINRKEEATSESADTLRELGVIGRYPCTAVWTSLRSNPAESGTLIEELRSEYLSSPEFTNSPRLYLCQPGGFLFFKDDLPQARSGIIAYVGMALELVESLRKKTRNRSDGKAVYSNHFIPGLIENDEGLLGMISSIASFNEYGFYLDHGATVDSVPVCKALEDFDVEGVREQFKSIPIESFIDFLESGFRKTLLESLLHRDELCSFVSGLVIDYITTRMKVEDTKTLENAIHTAVSLNDMIRGIAVYVVDAITGKVFNTNILHAIHFINRNLSQPLSLSVVAENIGISPGYLSSLFFRETGNQFNEYVTRSRMEKAKDLLRTSMYKVYEVSELVGILDYRYFSKLFKKYTGLAPKDFR